MQQALAAGQKLARDLQAGSLVIAEGRSLDYRIVLLPQENRTYLVGWPADTKTPQLSEPSKQLVATWDS
jgi:hypothetical protein